MSYNSNGLVRIAAPNGSSVPYALLSSSTSGSSTSAFGYTTTSLTLGPSIDNNTVLGSTGGGWKIYGTGPAGSNYTDLYAQLVDLSGSSSIGAPYSLLGNNGPTGPTGSTLNIQGLGTGSVLVNNPPGSTNIYYNSNIIIDNSNVQITASDTP